MVYMKKLRYIYKCNQKRVSVESGQKYLSVNGEWTFKCIHSLKFVKDFLLQRWRETRPFGVMKQSIVDAELVMHFILGL